MEKHWVVLGLGVSGLSALSLLESQGRQAIGLDRAFFVIEKKYPNLSIYPDTKKIDYQNVEALVVSPGISLDHPQVLQAKKEGVPILGEIELALRYTNNRCLAVTGTNGKTTVTELIVHILQQAQIPAKAVGNIGTSLSEYLHAPNNKEILVLELSSYQLETLTLQKIEWGVLLNITADHLDRHKSMQEYAKAKFRLQSCVKDPSNFWVSKVVYASYKELFLTSPNIFDKELPLIETLENPANICLENLYAAYRACAYLKISEEDFQKGIKTFRRPPHRLELVVEHQNIRYVNDSKATNVAAVCLAIENTKGPIVLIVGGVDKKGSYDFWKKVFRGKVRQVFITGESKNRIAEALQGHFPIVKTDSFQEAVMKACQCANEHDTVLLSPGCSSFDAFENFEKRGEAFKKLVVQCIGGKVQ